MKQSSLIFQLAISAIIGGVLSYFIFGKQQPVKGDTESDKTIFNFEVLEDYRKEGKEIPIKYAKEMVKAYEGMYRQSTGRTNDTLVRSVYFDFGPLAKYIAKMSLNGASGVRIYFGNYPEDEFRDIVNERGENERINLRNYNTVVLVATKKVNGEIQDILKDKDKNYLLGLYQPYNGGVSCPPYPASYCRGQNLLQLTKDSTFNSEY